MQAAAAGKCLTRTAPWLAGLAAVFIACVAPAQAETPAEKGLAIAREQDKRESGWKDYSAVFVMTLRSAEGKEAQRQMRMLNMEVKNDGDKSLTVFDTPKDVKGTALLTWSHKTTDDDVWLYLPSLARVKRIASNNKSGAFMGSEFAFEDMTSTEVEKYTYKYLRDERLDGQDCTVVEQIPTYANSGYRKLIVWRDKAEYRTLRIDYYDRKGQHLKTMRQGDYKLYLNNYWFPGRYEVKNLLTGRSTTLLIRNYKFGNGYSARDFDQTSLERTR